MVTKKGISNIRVDIVFYSFIFGFLFVCFRLFQIQALGHEKYESIAQEQYWDNKTISAKRGEIRTIDGYVLAGTQIHYSMYGEPKKIKDPYQLSNDLALLLSEFKYESQEIKDKEKDVIFKEYFEKYHKLLTKDLFWVPLEAELNPLEKKEIEDKGFEGIGFDEQPVRYYPEKTLSSHVLGFVASNDLGEKTGYYGIEGILNEDLKGKPGRLVEEIDAMGVPILMGNYKKIEPIQGRSVILTIDRSIQYLVEKKLKEGVDRYDAASGTIIVMNPSTGEVIAMANYPTYNPSDFSYVEKEEDKDLHRKILERRNLSISQTYEPGSVIKPLTISAAIDLGKISPTTTFLDEGPVWYSGHKIDNWDGKHHGIQNIIELLQKSNNIGAAWVGHQLGSDNLRKYFIDFGLGQKTGIDLEDEDTGIIRDIKEWTDIDLATAAFGQGISATPLQVLNAFNVIANGGYLLEPRIISKIVSESSETDIPSKSIRRVISKETSDTMIDLLEKAAEGGEAKYFILKNYRIAGKTGTAQIPEGGTYSPDRTNATFVGFLSGSKTFSMIVKLEEPRKSVYAAETSVPLWMELAVELAKFYGLPPDKNIGPVTLQ